MTFFASKPSVKMAWLRTRTAVDRLRFVLEASRPMERSINECKTRNIEAFKIRATVVLYNVLHLYLLRDFVASLKILHRQNYD